MKRLFVLCLLALSISSCARKTSSESELSSPKPTNSDTETKSTSVTEQKPEIVGSVEHEYARSRFDRLRYQGFKCGNIPLGISLPRFRELVHGPLIEEQTKFPIFLRKYSAEILPPVQGLAWKPVAKFVDDGTAYRLYTIEGLVENSPPDVVDKLSLLFGESSEEGFMHSWTRGGTKVRLIDANSQVLLSFTDDKLIDLSSKKMGEQLDQDAGAR